MSPSLQMWIPHSDEGSPTVEEVFDQSTVGIEGEFVGEEARREAAELSGWLLDSWVPR